VAFSMSACLVVKLGHVAQFSGSGCSIFPIPGQPLPGEPQDAMIPMPSLPLSKAQAMHRCRSAPVLHSSLQESLPQWKRLEPVRPRWPTAFHRTHLVQGLAVQDQDQIMLSSRDQVHTTKRGCRRVSAGNVIFSHDHREKAQLDAEALCHILQGDPPNSAPAWTLDAVDFEFRKTGRPGLWTRRGIPLCRFVSCFHRTFHVFGSRDQFVRLARRRSCVIDSMDEVMINLTRLKDAKQMIQSRLYMQPQTLKHSRSAVEALRHNLDVALLKRDGQHFTDDMKFPVERQQEIDGGAFVRPVSLVAY